MRLAPRAVDALIFTVTTAEAAVTLLDDSLVATVWSLVAAAGLLFRRRAPWVSVACVLPGLVFGCASIAAVVAIFSLAVRPGPQWLLWGGVGATFLAGIIAPLRQAYPVHPVALVTTAAMFALAPAAVGILTATRQRLVESHSQLRAAQDRQRKQDIAAAARHEREALAREMHDVVSHQVSLMAVQAGALQVTSTDTVTQDSARSIRALCVATLEELRTMLQVLRTEAGEHARRAPQPSLHELPALIDQSGLAVRADLELPDALPTSLQRAVFRTVQESLTNVRKHAPGSSVTVTGAVRGDGLEVRVCNSPSDQSGLALPGSGLGLLGLSERAEVLGGSVSAGPTAEGGFETVLRLPVTP